MEEEEEKYKHNISPSSPSFNYGHDNSFKRKKKNKTYSEKCLYYFPLLATAILGFMVLILIVVSQHIHKIQIFNIVKENIPLTPTSIQTIFTALSIRSTHYGQSILHCDFFENKNFSLILSSLNNNNDNNNNFQTYEYNYLYENNRIFIGNLKVNNNDYPPVWAEIFYDYNTDDMCYYLHAHQMKSSSPKCYNLLLKESAMESFYNLERMCFYYSNFNLNLN